MNVKEPGLSIAASSRQSARVCSRCRKRKTKCDFAYPSCGACAKAGAVCRAYASSATAGEDGLPRSLVRALEEEAAELERRIGELDQSPSIVTLAWTSKLAHATLSIDAAMSRPFFLSPVSKSSILCPSCPPLVISRGNSPDSSPAQPRHSPLSTNLSKIPRAAIEQLILNYANIHLPQYPCIPETSLRMALDRILQSQDGDTDAVLKSGIAPGSGLSHFDYFTVFIALAMSSLTLTWRNESQARAASDAFFGTALEHLQLEPEVTELQRLQASLLLAHYAHLNPGKVNNWACIWNATKIVLELGLHKEAVEKLTSDVARARLQNQLFWVTYGMERSLSTLLRLPLSISEGSISASADVNTGTEFKYSSAGHLYSYRKMEAEVHRVLYLPQESTQPNTFSIHDWLADITSRLEKWLAKAKEYSKYEMLEFRLIQYGVLRIRLFRPNPRLKKRTVEDRLRCFDACTILVEDYQRQVKQRRLFYPWHALHILFEAAVVMLEACWALRDLDRQRPQARSMLSVTVPDGLAVIAKMGESWPDAAACARYLEPIADEVASLFRERDLVVSQDAQQIRETALTAQLRGLLSPGRSTPQGGQIQHMLEQQCDVPGGVAEDAMAEDAMAWDPDQLDWSAYWDGVQDLSPFWIEHGLAQTGTIPGGVTTQAGGAI